MNQLLQGQPLSVFGDGLQTRAFSYIDDVAPVIARSPLVSQAWGQTFNIGADTPYTVLELAQEVAAAFGRPCEVKHLEARNEVVHAYADHSRVKRVFPPEREPVSLQAGIRRMAAWVEKRGAKQPVVYSNIEIEKNLPPSWRAGGAG
jgi:UDP-glucose 4-epimerase